METGDETPSCWLMVPGSKLPTKVITLTTYCSQSITPIKFIHNRQQILAKDLPYLPSVIGSPPAESRNNLSPG